MGRLCFSTYWEPLALKKKGLKLDVRRKEPFTNQQKTSDAEFDGFISQSNVQN